MDTYVKALAGVLVTLVLYLVLSKQNKDISVLLTIMVCCMVTIVAIQYLEPVISFMDELETIGQLNSDIISILFKTVGIALLAEITCLICNDAGNAALGKTLQILASGVILWLSVPLYTSLIELVEEILVTA